MKYLKTELCIFYCCLLQRKSRLMINLNKVTRCVVRGILRQGQRYLPVKLGIPPPNSLLSLHAHHSRTPYTYPPRYLYILTPIHLYLYYILTPIHLSRSTGWRTSWWANKRSWRASQRSWSRPLPRCLDTRSNRKNCFPSVHVHESHMSLVIILSVLLFVIVCCIYMCLSLSLMHFLLQ